MNDRRPGKPIYLDNHATTRVDPRVLEAMLPFFSDLYGNAASAGHAFGWAAADAVAQARSQIAASLGVESRDVIFTSGATESNNLALKGVARGAGSKVRTHLVTVASEHRAVLDPIRQLGREGHAVTVLPCDEYGGIDPSRVAEAIRDDTLLVSIMAANNEVGTLNDVDAIGAICLSRGVVFHTDAAQAVGKIPLPELAQHVDLLSLTAHKFHGPKGVGALYVNRSRQPFRIQPLVDGGGHERRLRSGTLPVPLVVGMGVALDLAVRERPGESARVLELRERLCAGLCERIPAVRVNGHPLRRLPGNLNLSFRDVDGGALLMSLRDVAVSSGSACSSAEPEPSHVLTAMGLDEETARASLRFGISRFTTAEEIDFAVEAVTAAVQGLRQHSIAWKSGVTNDLT